MLLFRTYPMSVCCCHLTIVMLLFTTPQCVYAVVAALLPCYCSQLLNVCMLLSPHYCHDIVHNSSMSVCCCRLTIVMILFTTPQCLYAAVASLLLCYCSQLLNVCMLLSPHYCHDIVHNSSMSVCCCRLTIVMLLFTTPQCLYAAVAALLPCYSSQLPYVHLCRTSSWLSDIMVLRPSNMRVYLRDGSAQTIARAATLR